jgi:hypothetical protein
LPNASLVALILSAAAIFTNTPTIGDLVSLSTIVPLIDWVICAEPRRLNASKASRQTIFCMRKTKQNKLEANKKHVLQMLF